MLQNRDFQEGARLVRKLSIRFCSRPSNIHLGGFSSRRELCGSPFQRKRAFHVATDDPIMASVAGRYASALFDLTKDENKIDEVEKDLGTFQALLHESEDLQRLVRSPVIASEDQSRALSAVLAKAGIGQLTSNFFKLIAKNRRLFAAEDMARAFKALAARHRGEVSAEVVSAHALSDEQTAELKAVLKQSVGKDVTLSTNVDASLLGGLIVTIGSRMIDSSLKTKLANMKAAMAGAN
jgi:F-type H+-transporting ATPase subunit delta